MKKIFARIATVIAIIVFAAFVSTTRPATSSAQSSGSGSGIVGLQGYAWSAFLDSLIPASSDDERKGGVGWVSFSSTDDGSGSTVVYGVTFDPFSGALSGSAWSSNYGWLSFDRAVTGNPPGSISDDPGAGTGPIAKKTNNKIIGWARFVSACQNNLWDGTKCTGVGAGDANGLLSGVSTNGQYWDGWVSLGRKTNDSFDYGLNIDPATGVIDGYAWGGSTNVGWINFHQGGTNPGDPPVDPFVTISSTPLSAQCSVTSSGGTISTANPHVSATWTASIVGGTAPYTVSWVDQSGPQSSSLVDGANTMTVTPSYGSGGVKTALVRVTDSATPPAVISSNSCSVTISEDTVNPPASCTIPANASFCTGSDDNQGNVQGSLSDRLFDNGSCPAKNVGSCVFQCNANYVRRGASCVSKSTVIEK